MASAPAAETTSVTLDAGHVFPPGTVVEAFDRVSDFPVGPPEGVAQASGTVDPGGDVTLTGLLPGGRFFLSGTVNESVPGPAGAELVERVRTLNFTATGDLPPRSVRHSQRETAIQADREGQAAQVQHDRTVGSDASRAAGVSTASPVEFVEGARSSADRPKAKAEPKPKAATKPKSTSKAKPAATKGN